MGERVHDDDRIWRAAFREGYRRNPRAGELRNYRYWHSVSRNRGFDVAGDWRDWPTKPIPLGAVVPELKPAPAPTPAPEQQVATPEPLPMLASPPAGNGRPRARERAERCLRELLAYGPRHGESVKRDAAKAAKVSERTLIAAAERLGVRSRRGQPG